MKRKNRTINYFNRVTGKHEEGQVKQFSKSGFLAILPSLRVMRGDSILRGMTEQDGWAVTHVGTGLSVLVVDKLPKARKIMAELDGDMWDFTDPSNIPHAAREKYATLQGIPIEKVKPHPETVKVYS